jgi:4-hydroxy-2-oxovalerate/4-hydroxy-2-oxohexanoate aldolase
MDIAENLIVPLMDDPVRIDPDALTLGYAGVYSSFLLFAKRSAEKYNLPVSSNSTARKDIQSSR